MSFADVSVYSTLIKPLRSSLQWLVTAALCLHASSALAVEGAGERLFREGRALMLDGRFAEACPKLEESQRLDPHVGTLLNLAACHDRQGKVGSAWVEYQKALTAARAEGQAERVQLAAARIKVLEPRVPWLRISSRSEDVTISLDGSPLEHVAWGQEMPVDPAPHLITAERSGAKVFEERVDLREGEHHTVHVEVNPPLPAETTIPQERVIIEPKPNDAVPVAPATPKKHASPWVLEPGLFLGFVAGAAAAAPRASADSVAIQSTRTGSDSTTCQGRSCTVGELGNASGVALGFNAFAGYAFSETVSLGVRGIVAPSLGSSGAAVYALGPSISLHATEHFAIGAFAFFGDAMLQGKVEVSPPDGYAISGNRTVHAATDLNGGLGVGLELSYRLFVLPRGEVVAMSTPLLIAGSNGSAVCVPIGLAYRFQ